MASPEEVVEAAPAFLAVFVVAFLAGFLTGDFFRVADFLPATFLAQAAFFLATLFFLNAAVPVFGFLVAVFLRACFLAFADTFFCLLSLAVLPTTTSITNVMLIQAAIIPNVDGIFKRQNHGGNYTFRYIDGGDSGSKAK